MPNNLINENHLEIVLKNLKQYIDENNGNSSSIENNLDELEKKITDLENYLDNLDIKTINGVEEAPVDGKKYCRHQKSWVDLSQLDFSTSEPEPEVGELKLTADKDLIRAGKDTVTLTLKDGDTDVTKDSTFTCDYNRTVTADKNKYTFDSLSATETNQVDVKFTGTYNGKTVEITIPRQANIKSGKELHYNGPASGDIERDINHTSKKISWNRAYGYSYTSGYSVQVGNWAERIDITDYNINKATIIYTSEPVPDYLTFTHRLELGYIVLELNRNDDSTNPITIDITGNCTNSEEEYSELRFSIGLN